MQAVAELHTSAARPLPLTSAAHYGHRCCLDRRNSRSLVGWADDGYRVAILDLKCRSWRCVCCAPALARRNRARAFQGATGRVAMVTLTLPAGRYSGPSAPFRSIRDAAAAWNRLRTTLRDRGLALPYFKGLELTKAGVAHLHVIVRVDSLAAYWRLRTLVRANAAGAGFGFVSQVDIARRPGDVARYVTKTEGQGSGRAAAYATKGVVSRLPRYTRRASWSKDWSAWVRPTPIAGFSWSVQMADAAGLRELYKGSEFTVLGPDALRVASAGRGPAEGG